MHKKCKKKCKYMQLIVNVCNRKTKKKKNQKFNKEQKSYQ